VKTVHYRYTGKERDDESGLYYHGARYYIPWLARWSASDPLESKYAGMSSYNYSFNNPVMFNDPSGMDPDDVKKSISLPVSSNIDTMDDISGLVKPKTERAPSGHLTPDGGRISLPKGTSVGDKVSATGEYRLGGKNVQLLPGGILNFTLEANTYNAQFDQNNKFIGYYTDDRKNYITYDGKSVPLKFNTSEAGAFMLAGWTAAGQTALADGPEPGPADAGGVVIGLGTTILSGLLLFDAASGNISMTKPVAIPTDLVTPRPNEDKSVYIYRSGNDRDLNFTPRPGKDDGTGIRSGLSFWITPQQAAMGDPKATIQKVNATQLIGMGYQLGFDTDGHVGVRRYSQDELVTWAKSRFGLAEGMPAHPLTTLLKTAIVGSKKISEYGK
jgi:RHS repeat-associated protein